MTNLEEDLKNANNFLNRLRKLSLFVKIKFLLLNTNKKPTEIK